MLIFPYRRVTVRSPRDPLAASQRLAERTVTRHRMFRLPPPEAVFAGRVDPEGFRLIPMTRGTSAYAPWIVGTIRPSDGGSEIKVRMTLHPGIAVALLGFSVLAVYRLFSGGPGMKLWWLAAIGALHVGLCYLAFRPEADRVKWLIRDIVA